MDISIHYKIGGCLNILITYILAFIPLSLFDFVQTTVTYIVVTIESTAPVELFSL